MKYKGCNVYIRKCMATIAVSKLQETANVYQKLSINLALSGMEKDFFPQQYFERLFHHSKKVSFFFLPVF